jgi:hypothetical protein
MKFFPRIVAACLTAAISFGVYASPTLTPIGSVSVLGSNYNVSLLSDVSMELQSIDNLSPTVTFTTADDAYAAASSLLSTFGSSFDWDTTCLTCYNGVRILYSIDNGMYSYFTVVGNAIHGSFTLATSGANAYSVAQFTPTISAVPEPSTYIMLLAGLGLIGFLSYRSKGNSSAMFMAA